MMKRPFVAVYLLVSTTMMVIYGCGGGGNGGGSGGTSPTGSGTGFNQARSFDREVFGIVPINDGSGDVFVAGAFTTYTDTISNRLIFRMDSTTQSCGWSKPVTAPAPCMRWDGLRSSMARRRPDSYGLIETARETPTFNSLQWICLRLPSHPFQMEAVPYTSVGSSRITEGRRSGTWPGYGRTAP
jgi:hypothetical protein